MITEEQKILEQMEEIDVDLEEFLQYVKDGETDFEIGKYRFIDMQAIDQIMEEEIAADEYILGCYNDWFLADVTDLPLEVFQTLQKAEAFEATGKLVLAVAGAKAVRELVVRYDGYGPHFASYDSIEHEIWFDERNGYYAFRID